MVQELGLASVGMPGPRGTSLDELNKIDAAKLCVQITFLVANTVGVQHCGLT